MNTSFNKTPKSSYTAFGQLEGLKAGLQKLGKENALVQTVYDKIEQDACSQRFVANSAYIVRELRALVNIMAFGDVDEYLKFQIESDREELARDYMPVLHEFGTAPNVDTILAKRIQYAKELQ